MKSLILLVDQLHTEFKRLRSADKTLQLGVDPKSITVGDITVCKIGGTITHILNHGGKKPSFPPAVDIVGLFLNGKPSGVSHLPRNLPTLYVDSYKFLTGFKPEQYCSYVEK